MTVRGRQATSAEREHPSRYETEVFNRLSYFTFGSAEAFLHFAAGTPYETRLSNDPGKGKRVMPSEVATALRGAAFAAGAWKACAVP